MPTPKQKLIHTPIPTLFVNILFKKVSICACSIFNNRYISERNKDVWMGNIVGLLKKNKKKKKKRKNYDDDTNL